jgi:hypothetical protein
MKKVFLFLLITFSIRSFAQDNLEKKDTTITFKVFGNCTRSLFKNKMIELKLNKAYDIPVA